MKVATFFFLAIPILEMVILIQVGSLIGVFPTILMVVFTAVVGVWLLRLEGTATLMRVQEKLAAGEIPGAELLEGVMFIIGGALLLTPGFATDFIGFVCLIPGLRRPLAQKIIASSTFRSMNVHTRFSQPGGGAFSYNDTSSYDKTNGRATIIEGEFVKEPGNNRDESQGSPQRKAPHITDKR